MVKAVAVIPKKLLDPAKMSRAIENTLNAGALGVKADFEVTQQTWKHKAKFKVEVKPGERLISTTDAPYIYVSLGTKPHKIRPKNPKGRLVFGANYAAKTEPRVIASKQGGSSGETVFAREVQHPGTKARQFEIVIARKWRKRLPVIMQRAIDAEV